MKSIFYIIALTGLALTGSSCIQDPYDYDNVDNTRYTVRDDFSYDLDANSRQIFELSAINGAVEVIAIPGTKTIRVWGEKSVSSESYDDAEEHLQELKVSLTDDAARVSVRTQQPENTRGRQYRVDYKVRIPASWQVTLYLVNGDAYLDNLMKTTRIEMVNGNLVLRNMSGTLRTQLTNGKIDAQMALSTDGRCELQSVNGQILLSIPTATSAAVTASLSVGTIVTSNLDFKNLLRTHTSLRGTLGDGDAVITLETVNGGIELKGD